MVYDCRGFWLHDFPLPGHDILSSFDRLPVDVYTEGGQRRRRFTAYRMAFENTGWTFEALPARPFLQPKAHNVLTGGVARQFEPMEIDPSIPLAHVADRLGLDPTQTYALNVHQIRIVTDAATRGVTVPEGPHRDGHRIIMTFVFARSNVSGGLSQLMPTGSTEPLFEQQLEPGTALVVEDERLWHHATDIVAPAGGRGHRDVWIVSLNPWDERRYGEHYEQHAMASAATGRDSQPA